MKHIQGGQLLKQTNGQKLAASHFLSSKMSRCPMLCPLLHVYSEALQQEPPAPLSHTDLCQTAAGTGAVTDTVFDLQVCALAGSTGSSSCSARAGTGDCRVGGGEERQLPASPRCVHSTHGSNPHTGLTYFAFPPSSTASSLAFASRGSL